MLEDYGQYHTQKSKKGPFLLSLLFYTGVCLATAYLVPHTVSKQIQTLQKNLFLSIPNGEKLHNMLFLAIKPQQILFHQTDDHLTNIKQGLYLIETTCLGNDHTAESHLQDMKKQGIPVKKMAYHNNKESCNKLQIGPFKDYASAQKIHIALQTRELHHHIYTER